MKVDLAALDPPPSRMVANLPYSVATPLLLRTIAELPSVGSWFVMVQREIAERLRAEPGHARVRLAERRRPARLRRDAWFGPSTPPCSRRGRGWSRRCCGWSGPGPARAARARGAGARGLRPPPQVAGPLARARAAGPDRGGAGGAGVDRRPRGRPRAGALAGRSSSSSGGSWHERRHAPRAGQAQPLPVRGPDARGRPARDRVDLRAARAGRRADGDRGGGAGRRGRVPRDPRAEPGREGRSRSCASRGGSRRRSGSRSRSGCRSPRGSAAAAPTRPRCCGWRAASSRACAASRPRSAPTFPPRSSRAPAWSRARARSSSRSRGRRRTGWC